MRVDVNLAMNLVEFRLRGMSSKSHRQPLGIVLFQIALNKWNYDLPPEDGLDFEDTLKQLKYDVK